PETKARNSSCSAASWPLRPAFSRGAGTAISVSSPSSTSKSSSSAMNRSLPGPASDGDPEPGADRGAHRLLHGRDLGGGVDHDTALRLGLGDLEKAPAQPLMKIAAHPFESGARVPAFTGPGKASLNRNIQDEREIGLEVPGDQIVERGECL